MHFNQLGAIQIHYYTFMAISDPSPTHPKDLIMYLYGPLGLFIVFLLVEIIWMLEVKKLTYFIMVSLRFSDRCSYSGEGVLLLVQSVFFRQVLLFEGVLLIGSREYSRSRKYALLCFNKFFLAFNFFLKYDIHIGLKLAQFTIKWWVKHNFTTIINNMKALKTSYPLKISEKH